jgi:hypothetical protein
VALTLIIAPPEFTVNVSGTAVDTRYVFSYYIDEPTNAHARTVTITNTSRVPLCLDTLMVVELSGTPSNFAIPAISAWQGFATDSVTGNRYIAEGEYVTFTLQPMQSALGANMVQPRGLVRDEVLRIWHRYQDTADHESRNIRLAIQTPSFEITTTAPIPTINLDVGEDRTTYGINGNVRDITIENTGRGPIYLGSNLAAVLASGNFVSGSVVNDAFENGEFVLGDLVITINHADFEFSLIAAEHTDNWLQPGDTLTVRVRATSAASTTPNAAGAVRTGVLNFEHIIRQTNGDPTPGVQGATESRNIVLNVTELSTTLTLAEASRTFDYELREPLRTGVDHYVYVTVRNTSATEGIPFSAMNFELIDTLANDHPLRNNLFTLTVPSGATVLDAGDYAALRIIPTQAAINHGIASYNVTLRMTQTSPSGLAITPHEIPLVLNVTPPGTTVTPASLDYNIYVGEVPNGAVIPAHNGRITLTNTGYGAIHLDNELAITFGAAGTIGERFFGGQIVFIDPPADRLLRAGQSIEIDVRINPAVRATLAEVSTHTITMTVTITPTSGAEADVTTHERPITLEVRPVNFTATWEPAANPQDVEMGWGEDPNNHIRFLHLRNQSTREVINLANITPRSFVNNIFEFGTYASGVFTLGWSSGQLAVASSSTVPGDPVVIAVRAIPETTASHAMLARVTNDPGTHPDFLRLTYARSTSTLIDGVSVSHNIPTNLIINQPTFTVTTPAASAPATFSLYVDEAPTVANNGIQYVRITNTGAGNINLNTVNLGITGTGSAFFSYIQPTGLLTPNAYRDIQVRVISAPIFANVGTHTATLSIALQPGTATATVPLGYTVLPVNFAVERPAPWDINVFWGEEANNHQRTFTLRNLSTRESINLADITPDSDIFVDPSLLEIVAINGVAVTGWPTNRTTAPVIAPNGTVTVTLRAEADPTFGERVSIDPGVYNTNLRLTYARSNNTLQGATAPQTRDVPIRLTVDKATPNFSITTSSPLAFNVYVGETPVAGHGIINVRIHNNSTAAPIDLNNLAISFTGGTYDFFGFTQVAADQRMLLPNTYRDISVHVLPPPSFTMAHVGNHNRTMTIAMTGYSYANGVQTPFNVSNTIQLTLQVRAVNFDVTLTSAATGVWGELEMNRGVNPDDHIRLFTLQNRSTREVINLRDTNSLNIEFLGEIGTPLKFEYGHMVNGAFVRGFPTGANLAVAPSTTQPGSAFEVAIRVIGELDTTPPYQNRVTWPHGDYEGYMRITYARSTHVPTNHVHSIELSIVHATLSVQNAGAVAFDLYVGETPLTTIAHNGRQRISFRNLSEGPVVFSDMEIQFVGPEGRLFQGSLATLSLSYNIVGTGTALPPSQDIHAYLYFWISAPPIAADIGTHAVYMDIRTAAGAEAYRIRFYIEVNPVNFTVDWLPVPPLPQPETANPRNLEMHWGENVDDHLRTIRLRNLSTRQTINLADIAVNFLPDVVGFFEVVDIATYDNGDMVSQQNNWPVVADNIILGSAEERGARGEPIDFTIRVVPNEPTGSNLPSRVVRDPGTHTGNMQLTYGRSTYNATSSIRGHDDPVSLRVIAPSFSVLAPAQSTPMRFSLYVGETPTAPHGIQHVRIRNTGAGVIDLSRVDIDIAGADAAFFEYVQPTGLLQPGAEFDIIVRVINPPAVTNIGNHTANVTVTLDPGAAVATVNIEYEVLPVNLDVTLPPVFDVAINQDESVDMHLRVITIRNLSTRESIDISTIETDFDEDLFGIVGWPTTGEYLLPGQEFAFTVRVIPGSASTLVDHAPGRQPDVLRVTYARSVNTYQDGVGYTSHNLPILLTVNPYVIFNWNLYDRDNNPVVIYDEYGNQIPGYVRINIDYDTVFTHDMLPVPPRREGNVTYATVGWFFNPVDFMDVHEIPNAPNHPDFIYFPDERITENRTFFIGWADGGTIEVVVDVEVGVEAGMNGINAESVTVLINDVPVSVEDLRHGVAVPVGHRIQLVADTCDYFRLNRWIADGWPLGLALPPGVVPSQTQQGSWPTNQRSTGFYMPNADISLFVTEYDWEGRAFYQDGTQDNDRQRLGDWILPGTQVTLPELTREGYTMLGWEAISPESLEILQVNPYYFQMLAGISPIVVEAIWEAGEPGDGDSGNDQGHIPFPPSDETFVPGDNVPGEVYTPQLTTPGTGAQSGANVAQAVMYAEDPTDQPREMTTIQATPTPEAGAEEIINDGGDDDATTVTVIQIPVTPTQNLLCLLWLLLLIPIAVILWLLLRRKKIEFIFYTDEESSETVVIKVWMKLTEEMIPEPKAEQTAAPTSWHKTEQDAKEGKEKIDFPLRVILRSRKLYGMWK